MKPTIILINIIILTFQTLSHSLTLTSPPQNDALAILAFKAKADPHNNLNYSINTTSTHCEWYGIQCQENGKVIRLVLEKLTLTGIFPDNTLTRLDQLRVLSLQCNKLTGSIPNLAGLVNLKTLFLDHNLFSGSVPGSISLLHRLRTLDLSYNKLSDVIPLEFVKLDRLIYLRLDSNGFNGSIPPLNQSSLQIFNISLNRLSGPVPVTPTLTRFSVSSYLGNPGLCGEIVRKECGFIGPFFGKSKPLSSVASSPPPRIVLGQSAELEKGISSFTDSKGRKNKRLWLILGFTGGLIVLVSLVLCVVISIKSDKKRDREKDVMSKSEILEMAAAADAAANDSNELEEKVRKVLQEITIGKSGNLNFCAGEAQMYNLEQLMRASAELLGRGSLATTYKAVLDDRLIVCVKRLDAVKLAGTSKEMFERHMEAVGGLRHPNLVPLRAYFQAKDERLLVYDYQANGSLFSLIHVLNVLPLDLAAYWGILQVGGLIWEVTQGSKSTRAKPLHWTSCLKIAEDIAQGLSYIHQAWRLVHGNLKLSNVLLGSDFEACLSDYCLSALVNHLPETINPESTPYEPPETRKLNHQSTAKSDIYSYGVLLLELLTGKPAIDHPHLMPDDMVKWVKATRDNGGGDSEDNRLIMLVEVAIVCRVSSPEQRPTMWQVLKMIQEIKEAAANEEVNETSS
ncbi:probable inactive receptor kinase [Tanacetum coccineum]